MAATFRQIVNNVLKNIGATQIPASNTTITDTYQLQVAGFVNQFKEEVENAGRWQCLWQTFNVTFPITLSQQPIVDAVTNATPNSRSTVVRMQNPRFGREVALVFDTTSFAIPFPLGEMPQADMIYYNTVLAQTPVGYSTNFNIQDKGQDSLVINVYPPANTQRTLQITMKVPQPRIDPTVAGNAVRPWLGTMGLDSPILVPNGVIEIGGSWYALQERGESLGQGSMFTEDRYREALDDSVSADQSEQGDLQMVVN
jgi:hypothetical protein